MKRACFPHFFWMMFFSTFNTDRKTSNNNNYYKALCHKSIEKCISLPWDLIYFWTQSLVLFSIWSFVSVYIILANCCWVLNSNMETSFCQKYIYLKWSYSLIWAILRKWCSVIYSPLLPGQASQPIPTKQKVVLSSHTQTERCCKSCLNKHCLRNRFVNLKL